MMRIRRSEERGYADHGWLRSFHTFSFADYYDPEHVEFGPLRVINEDRVRPGAGFPTHAHRDMEIVTYILEGALEHQDSIGTGSIIRPGEAQRMSAGAGITHSEFNHSKTDPVHFLQIWITPSTRAIAPGYEQRTIDEAKARAGFATVGSPDGRDQSVKIHQDAVLSVAKLERGQTAGTNLKQGRHGWVQVARGEVAVNGVTLVEGDGAAVSDEEQVTIVANSPAEVLFFDLA